MTLEKLYKILAKEQGISVKELKEGLTEAMYASNIETDNLDEFMTIVLRMVIDSIK